MMLTVNHIAAACMRGNVGNSPSSNARRQAGVWEGWGLTMLRFDEVPHRVRAGLLKVAASLRACPDPICVHESHRKKGKLDQSRAEVRGGPQVREYGKPV